MSLLTAVQNAMTECGLDEPVTVLTNTDNLVKRFRRFAQVETEILCREFEWSGLKVKATITGDGSSTTYDLPTDFFQFAPGNLLWVDDTPHIVLPLVTDQRMKEIQVSSVTPLYPVWRRWGDQIEFYPAPTSGMSIKFDYLSEYPIIDASLTTRAIDFNVDSDVMLIPERLVTLGIIWRYKKSMGLDYDEDFRTYEIEKARETGANTPKPIISLRGGNRRLGENYAYPGTITP